MFSPSELTVLWHALFRCHECEGVDQKRFSLHRYSFATLLKQPLLVLEMMAQVFDTGTSLAFWMLLQVSVVGYQRKWYPWTCEIVIQVSEPRICRETFLLTTGKVLCIHRMVDSA